MQSRETGQLRRAMLSWMSLSQLYAYLYCMMVSQALLDLPIFGGALFMSGQTARLFVEMFRGQGREKLSPRMKWLSSAAMIGLLLMNLFLLMFYPATLEDPAVWILFAMMVSLYVRLEMGRVLFRLRRLGRLTRSWLGFYLLLLHGIAGGCVIFIMTRTVEPVTAWTIFGGYGIHAAMEVYTLWRERWEFPRVSAPETDELADSLYKVNAYKSYARMYGLIQAAIQITLVMMYTYIAISAERILNCMVLSLLCTLCAREVTDWVLRRRHRKVEMDPTYTLLIGVFLWLYGLVMFYNLVRQGRLEMSAYITLALCSCGATVCASCLAALEEDMHRVACFGLGADEVAGYAQWRHMGRGLAQLGGQMVALAGLTALCFFSNADMPRNAEELARSFRPLMVVPALLVVIAAAVSVWRFPLSQNHLDKLSRFFRLKAEGTVNTPLQRQLEAVVIKRHVKMYGIKFLAMCIRPFYRHKIIGKENVDPNTEGLVFICNHGEVYGPVVTNVYVPFPFRPWVISDIADDLDTVAAYLYKYEIGPLTWLKESWKMPIARFAGRLALWMTRSIEGIPVYRNKPRQLMQTFRLSVEAMEAGDNLLIFPENPDAASLEQPGYLKKGVGEFYTGFTMLAQVYYNRTGKCCTFVPIFADKEKRTISFGRGIVYNPDTPPTEEKERIVTELKAAMERMAEGEA